MTEKSYFYNSGTGGDAVYSPYNRVEFNDYIMSRSVGDETGLFVIPEWKDCLKVVSGGTAISSVSVKPGAAIINGILYESDDAVNFNIDRTTTYFKIDFIVLRVDFIRQTVRLAHIESEETAFISTSTPALTQTDTIWEELVAWVCVDPALDYVSVDDVHDRRTFLQTSSVLNKYDRKNLLKNSEFMSFSGVGVATCAPEHWAYGSVGTITVGAPLSPQSRGRSITLNDETLSQKVKVSPGTKTFSLRIPLAAGTGSFSVSVIGIRANGVTRPGSTYLTQSFKDGYLETTPLSNTAILTETFTFEDDDLEYLTVNILSYGGTYIFGQPVLVEGYFTQPTRKVDETIIFQTAVTDASWTATAKSSGTTTIDLTASFSSKILPGTKAIIARLRGRDSASAATGTVAISALGYSASYPVVYGILYLGGFTNDKFSDMQCVIPVDQPVFDAGLSSPQFRVTVVASGAGTFDATIEIVGIII